MLWLALSLPHLALDRIARGDAPTRPLVISTGQGGRPRVFAANPSAARFGITPGMELGAARALAPDLLVHPREPQREASALVRLASWAAQFTPHLSLVAQCGVLLEIAGSLTLFGGLPALLGELRAGIATLGYRANIGLAPTPLGAWWAARAGLREPILDPSELPARLAPIPLERLDLALATLRTLRGLGLRTLGDCLRLPRADLAQRIDPELLRDLQRALGEVPDPRPAFTPPERFAARLPLAAEVVHSEGLVFAARRLLGELTGFLRARDAAVQGLSLELFHREGRMTPVPIGLLRADRDPTQLLELVRERLGQLPLPQPVMEIGLRAGEILPFVPEEAGLFGHLNGRAPTPWSHLVARLQARLGADRVGGIRCVEEHRPERAWARCPPGDAEGEGATCPGPPRPCWLLEEPRALPIVRGQPWADGPLLLLRGPERIESGWWDGGDVRRDYFLARSPRGARLWVFRELSGNEGWYLHGIFA